jgi:hypothetical protein
MVLHILIVVVVFAVCVTSVRLQGFFVGGGIVS